jgi:hypothetical protein
LNTRLATSGSAIGQQTAVRGAFQLAGYSGSLNTLPMDSGEEVCFVLDQDDLLALSDVRVLEKVLQQVLERKVWVLGSVDDKTVPFG